MLLVLASSAAAGQRSNRAAVALVARVAPTLYVQVGTPITSGTIATISSTSQESFPITLQPGSNASVMQFPVTMRANVSDFLLRATTDGTAEGHISLDAGEAVRTILVSTHKPLRAEVVFAIGSGLLRNSANGSPLTAIISVALDAAP